MSFDELEGILNIKNLPRKKSSPKIDPEWKAMISLNKDGRPLPLAINATTVLENHEAMFGRLWYNEFSGKIMVRGPLPRDEDGTKAYEVEHDDVHTISIRLWLQQQGISVTKTDTYDAIVDVSRKHGRHPVLEYLRGLRWDGDRRIDRFLTDYFGCEDTPYTQAVSSKFLISMVARIASPGCKVDTMLILEGKQGIGKSRALSLLVPDENWYKSGSIKTGDKDTVQGMTGKWLIEYAELSGMRKQEAEALKGFLTTKIDNIRKSYGRDTVDIQRQSVFVGTTNEAKYLRDETGDRRFWPVRATSIDVDAIVRDRDQLWAEAVEMWRAGAIWHLTKEEEGEANNNRSERRVTDVWEEAIVEYMAGVESATLRQVFNECLFIPLKDQHDGYGRRIKGIMERNGYEQVHRKTGGKTVRVYVKAEAQ